MTALAAMAAIVGTAPIAAQQPQGPQPYSVGNRVGLPVTPAANGAFEPVSSNVKVFGAIYSAESCSYDADRGVIVVPNRGVPQNVQTNNAWCRSSITTGRFTRPLDRRAEPARARESHAAARAERAVRQRHRERDDSTSPIATAAPRLTTERRGHRQFDMRTGARRVRSASTVAWFNDIEVRDDGTIYATQTGDAGDNRPCTWQVWKIAPTARRRSSCRCAAAAAERRRHRRAGKRRRREQSATTKC
jgi:hypothetical protein